MLQGFREKIIEKKEKLTVLIILPELLMIVMVCSNGILERRYGRAGATVKMVMMSRPCVEVKIGGTPEVLYEDRKKRISDTNARSLGAGKETKGTSLGGFCTSLTLSCWRTLSMEGCGA